MKRWRKWRRNYTWPDPDWWDFSCIPDQLLGKEEYPIQGGGSEPFLLYARMRGMEQAYMDLLVNPELALYCLDKLFDLAYTETVRIYEQIPGKVMLSYIAEDFGSQVSLLFAPATIREVFIPRMKRMMDLAHSAGAYVFYHSDGAIRPILPDMIAAGIDILNPIQWRCRGMERRCAQGGLWRPDHPPRRRGQPVHARLWQRRRGARRGPGEPGGVGPRRRLHPGALSQHSSG